MIRFDDALPVFVATLAGLLSAEAVLAGVIIRDVTGRLTFLSGTPIDQDLRADLEKALATAMGPYIRPGEAVSVGMVGGRRSGLLDDGRAVPFSEAGFAARLLDRRISGADWLRSPRPPGDATPRVVFASMKGGVGRSTALAMCALDLSADRTVLVVDLDVEAPGLGVFLLPTDVLPVYGTVDALAERKMGPFDDDLLLNLVQASPIGGGGLLLVCPAFGRRSVDHPGNVLSKIGRIYSEVDGPDGSSLSVLDQLAELVDGLVRVHNPDVVLIDARAGLHELTAATILGLGTEVLLFGLDEPQTWHAYRILLTQLHDVSEGARRLWTDALTPVQGKAPVEPARRLAFRAAWDKLVDEITRVEPLGAPPEPSGPSDDYEWKEGDTEVIPLRDGDSQPVCVLSDSNFAGFDPLGATKDRMADAVVRATFGSLLDYVRTLVDVR